MAHCKNGEHKISLEQQVYQKLQEMDCTGQSKREAKISGDLDGKIFSFSTMKSYLKHLNYFCEWMKATHPDVHTLKKAQKFSKEWLESREASGKYSAWTIQLEAKAINKLFGIHPGDSDYYEPPVRHREDIIRSRCAVVSDAHFSTEQNSELISFCRSTGLRRAGLESIRGGDLWSAEKVSNEISRISSIPPEKRTIDDKTTLRICEDTQVFEGLPGYYLHVCEKGGRWRLAPIVGPGAEATVARCLDRKPNEKVWAHVHSHCDVHRYRAEYACAIYRTYAREQIPKQDLYIGRKDLSGLRLDKKAILATEKALGHNSSHTFVQHYSRFI